MLPFPVWLGAEQGTFELIAGLGFHNSKICLFGALGVEKEGGDFPLQRLDFGPECQGTAVFGQIDPAGINLKRGRNFFHRPVLKHRELKYLVLLRVKARFNPFHRDGK